MIAKRLAILFGIAILFILIGYYAYIKGRNDVWISEFKIYESNLIMIQNFDTNLPPELKEFMKGRYYYLGNRVPRVWLGIPYDYGLPMTNSSHLIIGKGDTGPQYEYRVFHKRSKAFRNPANGNISQ